MFISKKEVVNEFLTENFELVLYSSICFFLPFFLHHSQWLTGTIVNTALVLSALRLKKVLPIIILPSLGVLCAGLLFGTLTTYLLYLIPFIWIGNALLVYFVKRINKKMLSLPVASIIKSLFLFSAAFILVKLTFIPAVFLVAMGPIQLLTALSGGSLALIVNKTILSNSIN